MDVRVNSIWASRPTVSFHLLLGLLIVLWVAGGASRSDALGQVVVCGWAWISLIVAFVMGDKPSVGRARPVAVLLLAALVLVLMQIVPLPPSIWQALPGRALFSSAALLSEQSQPWRPWSIVPEATMNALAALLVPAVILLLILGLKARERAWLPGLTLALIAASTLVGLLQFSGASFDNPLINESVGQVSGTFANRNHFALYLACGCLLAPVWAFLGERRLQWRGPIALALVLLFVLTILASGSRAGMLVGLLALCFGLLLSWQGIRRELRHAPKWALPALIAIIVGAIAFFIFISFAADRAQSINRAFALGVEEDMRSRGLPTVLAIIRTYFPFGTGFGSFDPMFRMHEPLDLLKPTYFNHAHNDFLEVVLDAGLPGVLLLLAALGWWAWASIGAWRTGSGRHHALPRLGSAMLFLVILASIVDYPVRTPMIMAVVVIAAVWLSDHSPETSQETDA
jgi:O-antigen ligase